MNSYCPENVITTNKSKYISSIMKQCFIVSSVWTQNFMAGLLTGAPTVFVPQLRKEATNGDEVIDDNLSSWLYSVPAISLLPFVIILPLFTKKVGRKIPQMITSIVTMTSFIVLYCSKNAYHILISEVIQGYLHAGNVTFAIVSVTEYTSPRLRGLFLTVTTAGFYWGLWIANAIGTFFHSRNIAFVGIFASIYTLTVVFWPESPYWLASKGRLEESKASFKWIHGNHSEKELRELIVYLEPNATLDNDEVKTRLGSSWRSPEFYKPLILSLLLITASISSGKLVCCVYILDMFKRMTSSEEAAYRAMLVLDAVTLLCIYLGSYLAKVLQRRTLYMSTAFIAVFFLLTTSLYLFLVRVSLLEMNNYIMLALLTAFSISITIGPMILSVVLYGELVSSKFQASSYMIIAFTISVTAFSFLKITPNIFATLGLDGSFLMYGVTSGLCIACLYVYLPETKDKTRWELDNLFVKKDISTGDELGKACDDETIKFLEGRRT